MVLKGCWQCRIFQVLEISQMIVDCCKKESENYVVIPRSCLSNISDISTLLTQRAENIFLNIMLVTPCRTHLFAMLQSLMLKQGIEVCNISNLKKTCQCRNIVVKEKCVFCFDLLSSHNILAFYV